MNSVTESVTVLPPVPMPAEPPRAAVMTRIRSTAPRPSLGIGGGVGKKKWTAPAPKSSQHLPTSIDNATAARLRDYLQSRYGFEPPPPPVVREAKAPVGKLARSHTVSLPVASRAPGESTPLPQIATDEKGLLSLVERGLVPPNADLTTAFHQAPLPVIQKRAPMHEWSQQFIRREPAPAFAAGFNEHSLRLDMITPVEPPQLLPIAPSPTIRGSTASTFAKQSAAGSYQHQQPAEDPRSFPELMDAYSLHHLIIRRGHTITSTPEFASFRRRYDEQWGSVARVLGMMEQLMLEYAVPIARVDGSLLALLASSADLHLHISPDDLLECLLNGDDVNPLVKLPGRRYLGEAGQEAAARKCQATFRMFLARRDYAHEVSRRWAAVVVQKFWRCMLEAKARRRAVDAIRELDLKQFDALQERFKTRWKDIQRRPRVIVHVPSISSMQRRRKATEFYPSQQNSQMSRLCDVLETGVDVIYVSPFPLPDDVIEYYKRLLALRVPDSESRIKFVHPENYSVFPSSMSLTRLLLYSPRSLSRIRHLVAGRDAYIVPGLVGEEEVKLCVALNLPLLGIGPRELPFGTKSGAKRLFMESQVSMPLGAYDVTDDRSLYRGLATLIAANLDMPRWLMKIDDESGGKGIAVLETSKLDCMGDLRAKRKRYGSNYTHPDVQRDAVKIVLSELAGVLAENAHIACPASYPSWKKFLKEYCRVGGVIEACPPNIRSSPSVNLFVSPTGAVSVLSTQDQVLSNNYLFCGALIPQATVPPGALFGASIAIGEACYRRGIIGFIGVDYVSFWDSAKGIQRLWAVDLNLRYTPTLASMNLYQFMSGAVFDGMLGTLTLSEEKRFVALVEMYTHGNLARIPYPQLLVACRARGMTFDLDKGHGVTLSLMDSFASGVIGVACASGQPSDALKSMTDSIESIDQLITESKMEVAASNVAPLLAAFRYHLELTVRALSRASVPSLPTPRLSARGKERRK